MGAVCANHVCHANCIENGICVCADYADIKESIVQRHSNLVCTPDTANKLTCIERPPGPPHERQLTLIENRVQDVRGVSMGVCPKCWLTIRCFGALQCMHFCPQREVTADERVAARAFA